MENSLALEWKLPVHRVLGYRWLLMAVVIGVAFLILGDDAFAQRQRGSSTLAPEGNRGVASSTLVPASQVFSCGSGFTFFSVSISTHGNVTLMESPSGFPHIFEDPRGFAVCHGDGVFLSPVAFDFGGTEAGWAVGVTTSQPNGANTFPLEISRNTADGVLRVTRRITGNSFVGPVTVGNATYDQAAGGSFPGEFDGQGCSSMSECGNCTNRTIHVLTRITNLTGVARNNVGVIELVKIDADGSFENNWGRTGDSVFAWLDRGENYDFSGDPLHGVLLQSLIVPPDPGVFAFEGAIGDCIGSGVGDFISPTPAFGDFEAFLLQRFGTLGAFANTGGALRTHYRRY